MLQKMSKYSSSVLRSSYFIYIISAICPMVTFRSWRNYSISRQDSKECKKGSQLFSEVHIFYSYCLFTLTVYCNCARGWIKQAQKKYSFWHAGEGFRDLVAPIHNYLCRGEIVYITCINLYFIRHSQVLFDKGCIWIHQSSKVRRKQSLYYAHIIIPLHWYVVLHTVYCCQLPGCTLASACFIYLKYNSPSAVRSYFTYLHFDNVGIPRGHL